MISERSGSDARRLYTTLCEQGPFRQVDPELFARLLRWIGRPEVALIEQAPDGTLLLGRGGERVVEHYTFYAAFQTPEEYRIVRGRQTVGNAPTQRCTDTGHDDHFLGSTMAHCRNP